MLIWGLSEQMDPVSRLFSRWPFTLGERISYPQYLLQAPIYQVVKKIIGPDFGHMHKHPLPAQWIFFNWAVWMTLVCCAFLTERYIDRPCRAWLQMPATSTTKKQAPEIPLAENCHTGIGIEVRRTATEPPLGVELMCTPQLQRRTLSWSVGDWDSNDRALDRITSINAF